MKNTIMEALALCSAFLGMVSVGMFIYFMITSLRPAPILLSAGACCWYWVIYEITSRRIK